jgi:deoxycytidine triphosphate deaminase
MSILTYNELVALVDSGAIENVKPEYINGASIDLTLADGFFVEEPPQTAGNKVVLLGYRQTPAMKRLDGCLLLAPGAFALAATKQIFHLPNDIAGHYMLKSSLARAGLQHLFAGFAPTQRGTAVRLPSSSTMSCATTACYCGPATRLDRWSSGGGNRCLRKPATRSVDNTTPHPACNRAKE